MTGKGKVKVKKKNDQESEISTNAVCNITLQPSNGNWQCFIEKMKFLIRSFSHVAFQI